MGKTQSVCRFSFCRLWIVFFFLGMFLMVLMTGSQRSSAFVVGVHREITTDVLSEFVRAPMIVIVEQQVSLVDADSIPFTYVFDQHYMQKSHCDRRVNQSNEEAFEQCQNYFMDLWDLYFMQMRVGDEPGAFRTFGQLLHVQQDFFSHSSAYDLSVKESDVLSCWDGSKRCSQSDAHKLGILITQYEPGVSPLPTGVPMKDISNRMIESLMDRRHGGKVPIVNVETGGFAVDAEDWGASSGVVIYNGVSRTRFEVAKTLAIKAGKRTVRNFIYRCSSNLECWKYWREKWMAVGNNTYAITTITENGQEEYLHVAWNKEHGGVAVYPNQHGSGARWKLVPQDNGTYSVTTVTENGHEEYLHVAWNKEHGNAAVYFNQHGSGARWKLIPRDDDTYAITTVTENGQEEYLHVAWNKEHGGVAVYPNQHGSGARWRLIKIQ